MYCSLLIAQLKKLILLPIDKYSRNSSTNKPYALAVLVSVMMNALSSNALATEEKQPMEVKMVVVSMFEIGDDAGDAPGEFQLWKARQKPPATRHLRKP